MSPIEPSAGELWKRIHIHNTQDKCTFIRQIHIHIQRIHILKTKGRLGTLMIHLSGLHKSLSPRWNKSLRDCNGFQLKTARVCCSWNNKYQKVEKGIFNEKDLYSWSSVLKDSGRLGHVWTMRRGTGGILILQLISSSSSSTSPSRTCHHSFFPPRLTIPSHRHCPAWIICNLGIWHPSCPSYFESINQGYIAWPSESCSLFQRIF